MDQTPPSHTTDLSALAERRFRAGHGYELVVFDRLPAGEQVALAELRSDPTFYGVLKPRAGSRHTVKAVDRDTALLWLTLREPGPLPFFVWAGDPGEVAQGIAGLVLDGVLEVAEAETADDAERWIAGAVASGLLLPADRPAPQGRLAHLSAEALRHTQALELDDPGRIAAVLYGYHRLPVTPTWARRLGDRAAVLDFLGASPGTALARRLDADWERAKGATESEGWIAWSPRGGRKARSAGAGFKLYVSPQPEALPAAFAAVVETLGARGGGDFKVGSDAAGLLRPDKLVLYFADREDLLATADQLGRRLAGLPAHGVPFTAEIGLDGALSWGMDPPKSARLVAWHEGESWRIWVVRRLAAALLSADRPALPAKPEDDGAVVAPWQFALERLRREGVDVDRWTPAAHLWQAA